MRQSVKQRAEVRGKVASPGTVLLGAAGRGCSAPSASTRISPEASGSVDLGIWVSKLLDLSKGEKKNKIRKTGTKKESNSVHLRLAQFRGLRA